MDTQKGFTLIELLIVIAVIAVLTTVVVVVLDPAEYLREARDTTRMSDLANINKALSLFLVDQPGGAMGTANTVYVSLPSPNSNCSDLTLPSLPSSWVYKCSTSANYRKTDNTGWLPVALSSVSYGGLAVLPIDPVNKADSGNYYTYVTGGSWALASQLESQKYLKAKALTDGGTDPARLELGSNLKLWANASGLVGYWSFDEGSGTLFDSSGNGHSGSQSGGVAYGVAGKVNKSLSFDGTNDIVNIGTGTNYFPLPFFSACAWAKTTGLGSGMTRNGIIALTYGLSLFLDSSGKFTTYMDNGTSIVSKNVLGNLHDNNFHYLCLTFDGSNRHMYVDGVEKLSEATTWVGTTQWPTNACNIGRENNDAYYFFNGLIDEPRIYNRALSANEIKAIYEATK